MIFHHLRVLGVLCIFSLSQGPSAPAQAEDKLPVEALYVHTLETVHTFDVEVAQTDAQRARGLMHRDYMADMEGMLFIFEASGERYFWMRDTPLSLDIIFAAEDGVIIRIADNTVPFSDKIIPSRGDSRFVLEVLAGTAAKLGIEAGDRLVSASISQAKQGD